MKGGNDEPLRGEAGKIIGRNGNTNNNGFKKKKGKNTDCPRKKAHGDEIDGKKKNFNNGFNNFIKKEPNNSGSKQDTDFGLNREARVDLVD